MEDKILTEKRMSTMEQKIDNLIVSVDRVNDNVEKVDSKLEKHVEWEAEKYEKLDTKYSAKWVESAIIAISTGLVISIVGGLFMYFVKIK